MLVWFRRTLRSVLGFDSHSIIQFAAIVAMLLHLDDRRIGIVRERHAGQQPGKDAEQENRMKHTAHESAVNPRNALRQVQLNLFQSSFRFSRLGNLRKPGDIAVARQ